MATPMVWLVKEIRLTTYYATNRGLLSHPYILLRYTAKMISPVRKSATNTPVGHLYSLFGDFPVAFRWDRCGPFVLFKTVQCNSKSH